VITDRRIRRVLGILLLLTISLTAHAQTFSEKKEVAIFRLNYYGAPHDPPRSATVVQFGNVLRLERRVDSNTTDIFREAVGAVDEHIRSVFINLGRFNVIGLTHRLDAENVSSFIDVLSTYREQSAQLPETVLLGQEAFTQADFNRISKGFIVVIPSVSYYNLELDEGEYNATIETSFTFINVQDLKTEGQFFIETSGQDENAREAMKSAVDGIPAELSYQLRSMDIFKLRTGVIEVAGREAVLEFGKNMGIKRGDEYAIVQSRVTSTGHQTNEETGLLLIKEVREQYSVAQVLYANPPALVGDQLEEVPRYGIEGGVYTQVLTDPEFRRPTFILGLRGVASRGFYTVRPLGGIEIPFTGTILGLLFPINLYGGAEANWYMGRLKLNPSFSIGLGGGIPIDKDLFAEDFYLTHFGGTVKMTLSYLVSRDTLIYADLGYGHWFGIYNGIIPDEVTRFFNGYGGILIGAGVTLK